LILPFLGIEPIIPESCYLAPGAVIIGDVILGDESSVWFHTVVRGDVNYVRIGRRTNIQDLCTLHVTDGTHPLNIGDNVTVGHGAIVHGCSIEETCLIGIGARILDGAQIGRESVVAAGALISPGTRIPPRSLVMGIPGRVKRTLEDKEVEEIRNSAQHYVDAIASYRSDAK
jgi:carbonic anhydrase/acetyltransferase-like protein (isoleucine patch superfamily)